MIVILNPQTELVPQASPSGRSVPTPPRRFQRVSKLQIHRHASALCDPDVIAADCVRDAVTDNLFSQGVIAQNLVAIFFQPVLTTGVDGELTFGATDATRFVGTISFA